MTPSVLDDNWVVKSLVSVKYPKDDPIGAFFGYYSLLVYQIQAIYITIFLRNRDMLTFYCCFTHLLSEIATYSLKHYLKQPRPDDGPPLGGGLFEGRYGMPSQHCHCFAYLITMILLLVFHYYPRYISHKMKLLVAGVSTVALSLQVAGRVYLKYHTMNQCLIGLLFGSLSAVGFYTIGLSFFMPNSNKLCHLALLRFFSFKQDLVSPPPATHEQYNQDRQSKRSVKVRKSD